jgi:hypothetical protein
MAQRTKKKRRTTAFYTQREATHVTACLTWGCPGNGDGMFDTPNTVVATSGMIFVSDLANSRIQCFDYDGKFLRKWGDEGSPGPLLDRPTGIAPSVANGMNESITREMLKVPQLYAFPPGVMPICVAYVGNEILYVCDNGTEDCRMVVYDFIGTYLASWGKLGRADGEFFMPEACAVDRQGVLYVLDDKRVQVFRPMDGKYEPSFVCKWNTQRHVHYPRLLALSPDDGTVFVASGDAIMRYTANGEFVDRLQLQTSPFDKPYIGGCAMEIRGLCVASDGMIYISDHAHPACVRQFRPDRTFVKAWISDKLHQPCGIDIGINGEIYVAYEKLHRIVAFNVPTKVCTECGETHTSSQEVCGECQ